MANYYSITSRTIVVDGVVCLFTTPCKTEPTFLRGMPPPWKAMLTRTKLALDKVDNLENPPVFVIRADKLEDNAPLTKYKPQGVYEHTEWTEGIVVALSIMVAVTGASSSMKRF